MPEVIPADGPSQFKAWMRSIEQRIDKLETARRLPNSSMSGGTFELTSEDGHPKLLFFGTVASSGDGAPLYGVQINDAKGDVVFAVDESVNGIVYPQFYGQWTVPQAQSITNSSFVTVAECSYGAFAHDVMVADAAIVVPAGTTAEVRVFDNANSISTNTLSVSASGNVRLNWLHPYKVGWGDDRPGRPQTAFLQWQVRRSGGAGTILAFPPRSLTFLSSRFASGESDTTPLQLI